MKKNNDNIISILSIIGTFASIVALILATGYLDKINTKLVTGIFASIIGVLANYLYYYIKRSTIAIDETKAEVETLKKQIKEILKKQKKQRTVFVSYNHKDRDKAHKIISELKNANLKTWNFEEDIKVGENWKESIENALLNADYFLYLISKDTSNSKYLSKELEIAMKKNKKILPVIIDDSKIPEIISTIKYTNINEDYYEGIEELLNSLKIDIERSRIEN